MMVMETLAKGSIVAATTIFLGVAAMVDAHVPPPMPRPKPVVEAPGELVLKNRVSALQDDVNAQQIRAARIERKIDKVLKDDRGK